MIAPPNGSGGGGSCFPSSVTVALGEPGTPVICWADAGTETDIAAADISKLRPYLIRLFCFMFSPLRMCSVLPKFRRLLKADDHAKPPSNTTAPIASGSNLTLGTLA